MGSEESGWLDALFSLPVARWRVLVGTYLGRATVFVAATVLGFGLPGLLLLWEFGTAGWPAYLGFVLASTGAGLAFLAIALVVSTLAREKAHALGGSLLAWAWFVLVHDLLALGVIGAFDLPDAAIAAMVLSNPVSVFRLLALAPLSTGGDGGFAAVFAASDLSVGLLVGALLAWIALPVTLAATLVGRRSA
ncbi:MAG: ABC transporter permease subunit [Halalkalicoccus sp.]